MTIKEELFSLKGEIEELVGQYNDIVNTATHRDVEKKKKEINDKVKEYLSSAKRDCFSDLKETENPLVEAVKTLQYGTVKVSNMKGDDSVAGNLEVVDTMKSIDILELYKFINNSTPDWEYKIQNLNFLFTARVAKDLNANDTSGNHISIESLHNSYAMKKIARDIENPTDKSGDPVSNTQLLKALNGIVAEILGKEFKAKSKDVIYLRDCSTKKDNKNVMTVKMPTHTNFRKYVTEVLHRVYLNEDWNLAYNKAKEK